ncbi:hypothetical protein [Chitinophaga agri]|uniref:Uncharacterized protein n=1 Tax=Chitinophaga agri TaxID=2703787 RepID=A0A6B9ZHN8_9BACT|nr:hypothetical protein [Chitinophaga agri]QHS60844.1 hypothetical protein GWR21_14935 [Chitinophaga agri]
MIDRITYHREVTYDSKYDAYTTYLDEHLKRYYNLKYQLLINESEKGLSNFAEELYDYYYKYKKISFSFPYSLILLTLVIIFTEISRFIPDSISGFCWGVLVTLLALMLIYNLESDVFIYPVKRKKYKLIVENQYQKRLLS